CFYRCFLFSPASSFGRQSPPCTTAILKSERLDYFIHRFGWILILSTTTIPRSVEFGYNKKQKVCLPLEKRRKIRDSPPNRQLMPHLHFKPRSLTTSNGCGEKSKRREKPDGEHDVIPPPQPSLLYSLRKGDAGPTKCEENIKSKATK